MGSAERLVSERDARLSGRYLLAGAAAVGCYLVVPGLSGNTWLFEIVAASAAVALVAGVRRYRPRPRAPWVLFIIAQVLFLGGDFFYYTFDLEFPAPADALYLAYYPLQVAGLFLLIRSRAPGKDTASLVDALTIGVAFGVPSWVYLIEPYATDTEQSQIAAVVSMAYPAMDVVLLAVAARLVMGGGMRSRAFALMSGSILALVVTDVVYGAIELSGSYNVGSLLDVGWMLSYVLWGAAALHPSMRHLADRVEDTTDSLTGRRILILAGLVMVGPLMIGVNALLPTDGFDLPVVLVGTAVIFLLAVVRIFGLASRLRDAIARHERAEQREKILRHAMTAITAAQNREYVRLAALEGALALARDLPGVEVAVEFADARAVPGGSLRTPAGSCVVSLATRAAPYGRLAVTSDAPLPTDVVDALQTLGAQVALALEASALSDDLSRQRSEARVGALVQNSSEMIMVVDRDLIIRYVTPSVGHSLGHRPEDLVGKPAASMSDAADAAVINGFYQSLLERPGKSVTAEWRMRRVDGQFTDFEAVVTNLLDHPSVSGILVTAHDITDRKALEVALKRQVEELEELDRIRSEFVATVSHELRTPLTNIIGEIELLSDGDRGELSSCQAQGIDVIGRNSERLFALIDDLLTLSHIEAGEIELHREPTEVVPMFDRASAQILSLAAAKSVTVHSECSPDAGIVVADSEQLDRVLLNLLTNAVKFTPEGGEVLMRARRSGDDLEFTVSDNGVGIPVDEQIRLFTRFFRSSVATKLAIQGTGLGLVIVKRIVEAHEGTIAISSLPDVGTTVTVRIPVGDVAGLASDVA